MDGCPLHVVVSDNTGRMAWAAYLADAAKCAVHAIRPVFCLISEIYEVRRIQGWLTEMRNFASERARIWRGHVSEVSLWMDLSIYTGYHVGVRAISLDDRAN